MTQPHTFEIVGGNIVKIPQHFDRQVMLDEDNLLNAIANIKAARSAYASIHAFNKHLLEYEEALEFLRAAKAKQNNGK